MKKNISTVERNSGILEDALNNYSKYQTRIHYILFLELQKKSIKIATVLEIIADQENEATKLPLLKLSKLLQQREILRGELSERIESACVDPLSAYPLICDKLLVLNID